MKFGKLALNPGVHISVRQPPMLLFLGAGRSELNQVYGDDKKWEHKKVGKNIL